ncbi:MAG TPA: DUF1573 domain-containing protein [Gemmataceae bacterium]|nr:DUF1573 domain-containing protein [Gemmataceae bacterium]
MFRYSLVVLLGLCATGPASASWADSLFDELSRDFGSVPRGPTLTHSFRLVNKTGAHVHISNVRVSCGCTSAHALQTDLAPGQETAILVQMDTRRFQHAKNVTIFVQFDQPRFDEVRLWVQANSRDDVTVIPESVAFGRIKRGSVPANSVRISFLGSGDWQILGVKSDSNYVQSVVKELHRDGGEVSYQLTTTLRADAPAGKWYTDLWLQTNNPTTPRVRVPLTVEIEAPISVSPMTVVLGEVKAGTQAERRIIVRGAAPFRITAIKGTDAQLDVREAGAGNKAVHILTVTLRPDQAGELNRTLQILTDLRAESNIEFTAKAHVVK